MNIMLKQGNNGIVRTVCDTKSQCHTKVFDSLCQNCTKMKKTLKKSKKGVDNWGEIWYYNWAPLRGQATNLEN